MLFSERIAAFIFFLAIAAIYALEIRQIIYWIYHEAPWVYIRGILHFFGGIRRSTLLRRVHLTYSSTPKVSGWSSAKADKFIRHSRKPITLAGYVIHSVAILGIVCMLYGYFIEPYWIETNYLQIKTLALKKAKIRVVQISDLHCDIKKRNEPSLANRINELNPDIVVFTGDCLNTSAALPNFQEAISGIRAKIGLFAVKGNWDGWYWKDLELFKGTGFKVLDNRAEEITIGEDKIYLVGISCNDSAIWDRVIKGIPHDEFCIFLYHYPDLADEVRYSGIDLYLAGHTHGGQVRLPFYGAMVTLSQLGKKYESGKYMLGDLMLYVNRGIGMEGGPIPRVRFLCRPEITVFDIHPE